MKSASIRTSRRHSSSRRRRRLPTPPVAAVALLVVVVVLAGGGSCRHGLVEVAAARHRGSTKDHDDEAKRQIPMHERLFPGIPSTHKGRLGFARHAFETTMNKFKGKAQRRRMQEERERQEQEQQREGNAGGVPPPPADCSAVTCTFEMDTLEFLSDFWEHPYDAAARWGMDFDWDDFVGSSSSNGGGKVNGDGDNNIKSKGLPLKLPCTTTFDNGDANDQQDPRTNGAITAWADKSAKTYNVRAKMCLASTEFADGRRRKRR